MKRLQPDELRTAGFIASKVFDKEKHDLDHYVLMARCVMDAAMALAELNPKQEKDYRSIAMNTSFNIAAACWPGWDDAHDDISAENRRLALELGALNVKLGRSLDAPASRRFNGYWIFGVHQMADRDFDGARSSFEAAQNCAELIDSEENRLMAKGWILANDILERYGKAPEGELLGVIERLRALGEDGEFYAAQYAPALARLSVAPRVAEARSSE